MHSDKETGKNKRSHSDVHDKISHGLGFQALHTDGTEPEKTQNCVLFRLAGERVYATSRVKTVRTQSGGHHEINWMQNRGEKSPEQMQRSHGRILWICKEITPSGAIWH